MESVNRIITAKDYCKREGATTIRERIRKRLSALRRKNILLVCDYERVTGRVVYARIELGQWCANCECGGVEFVDHEDPIFYCMSCGNRADSGALRPVLFPEPAVRVEIERLVLERPVDDLRGLDDADRAAFSKPVIYIEKENGRLLGLTRSWDPHESVEDLTKENAPVQRWKQEKEKGEG